MSHGVGKSSTMQDPFARKRGHFSSFYDMSFNHACSFAEGCEEECVL